MKNIFKKTTVIFAFLAIVFFVSIKVYAVGVLSPEVHFDCPNLKQALIDEGFDSGGAGSTAGDGILTEEEMAAQINHYDLSSKSITDLTGIGYASSTRGFNLSDNDLSAIESGDLTGLAALQTLNLDKNKIVTIDTGSFTSLTSLITLYINDNEISSIENGDFTGLDSVKYLYLNNNKIPTLVSGAFTGLPILETLHLEENQITSIENGAFTGFVSLLDLSLQNNKISSINSVTFEGLPSLTDLNLEENLLSSISNGDFSSLVSLEDLKLNNNQISSVAAGTFSTLSNLKTIYLYSNKLTTIKNGVFSNVVSLKTLLLDANQISSIESGAFSGLTSLTALSLGSNQISSIPASLFSDLSAMRGLILSDNKITSFKDGTFEAFDYLDYMFLDNNKLTSITKEEYEDIGHVLMLVLSGNNISSFESDGFSEFDEIIRLYLDYNLFTDIDGLPDCLSGIPGLSELYISYNYLNTNAGPDLDKINEIKANGVSVFYEPQTEYLVSYDLNGGTGTVPPETGYYYDMDITLPSEPTKDGKVFVGWDFATDGKKDTSAGDTIYTITPSPTESFGRLDCSVDYIFGSGNYDDGDNTIKVVATAVYYNPSSPKPTDKPKYDPKPEPTPGPSASPKKQPTEEPTPKPSSTPTETVEIVLTVVGEGNDAKLYVSGVSEDDIDSIIIGGQNVNLDNLSCVLNSDMFDEDGMAEVVIVLKDGTKVVKEISVSGFKSAGDGNLLLWIIISVITLGLASGAVYIIIRVKKAEPKSRFRK